MSRYFNIFTILMAVTVFALTLRLLDISQFKMEDFQTKKSEPVKAQATPVAVQGVNLEAPKTIQLENISINQAFAEDPKAKDTNVQDMTPTKQKYGETIYSESEIEVLKSLSARRKELDTREEAVVKKEALLSAAEKEVDKKVSDLMALKQDIENLLNNQQSMDSERVASLVKIYEGMKPQQAAKIFDTLDMNITLAVLGAMKEKKASSILEFMSPDKARVITTKLAEQYKLPDQPQ